MIAFFLLAVLTYPYIAQATVFWDDELESGNTGYNLADLNDPSAMTFDTSVKYSGSGSLRYDYPSVCLLDSNGECGGFMDRGFTSTTTFFRRFYIRLSPGFQVSTLSLTKLMRSDTDGPNSNWWAMGCCGSREFKVANQNVPAIGDTTNVSSGYDLPDSVWMCIETQETLNTPGVANGITRAWIDGVQVMNATDTMYRQSGDTSTFLNNRLYRQSGEGSIWFDRLAVGDTRIGCLSGGGSTAGGGLDF